MRIFRYDGRRLSLRYALGPVGFTRGYSTTFKALTVMRNPKLAKRNGSTGGLSPYLVLDADSPVPFYKWPATAEAMAHAKEIDQGLRSLGLSMDPIDIPVKHLPQGTDPLVDEQEPVKSLGEEQPASPDTSITIEYQGNAVAIKMLPKLGKMAKSLRSFGFMWTGFIAIFTVFLLYSIFWGDGEKIMVRRLWAF